MGLGLHGGGVAAAKYLASVGCRVLVTDLRDASVLAPSVAELDGMDITFVLGSHAGVNFTDTDLVVKNPGVPVSSPYLRRAQEANIAVETDISLFLRLCPSPLVAVTGSKGKSTTASAVHHCLRSAGRASHLGGNITVSPLSFLTGGRKPGAEDRIVLELSSWQLGDLRGMGVLHPDVSVVTSIFPDHMDRYEGDFEAYLSDKKEITREQQPQQLAVLNADDPHQRSFAAETRARVAWYSSSPSAADAWIHGREGRVRSGDGEGVLFSVGDTWAPHHALNLLAAGLALHRMGLTPEEIRLGIETFPGVEHRLELFYDSGGIRGYNDSAATVPQATLAAARSMTPPFVLICGGTDKALDFSSFAELGDLEGAIYLLEGSATQKIIEVFRGAGVEYHGPYPDLASLLRDVFTAITPPVSVLFSPGCTSFGMFLNEFDRGRTFKQTMRRLLS